MIKLLRSTHKQYNTMSTWASEKQKYFDIDIDSKRKLYKNKDFITLDQVITWHLDPSPLPTKLSENNLEFSLDTSLNQSLAKKISIWKGDITKLEIDAIVNAANNGLLGGGGVDGAIHSAAGEHLKSECRSLMGCKTGDAKLTGGYSLPAKYVIHSVGPKNKSKELLASCYKSCLSIVREENIKSIAFPCISTGVYHFPNKQAAHIALSETRKFLEDDVKNHGSSIERVIFCVFLPEDETIYQNLGNLYFPKN